MKNQYFGDARDFYKYDLLFHLMGLGLGFDQLVMGWWLTPDDDSTDGEVRDYKVGLRDAVLHEWLQARHHRRHRDVRQLAEYPGVAGAGWACVPVHGVVPLGVAGRAAYVDEIAALAAERPSLVFLDPDNGMMTTSATYSTRPKYVDYPEVTRILGELDDHSLLVIYQHVPRVKRDVFYPAALARLREDAGVEHATWLSPDNLVVYFLAARTAHRFATAWTALRPYLYLNGFHVSDNGSDR